MRNNRKKKSPFANGIWAAFNLASQECFLVLRMRKVGKEEHFDNSGRVFSYDSRLRSTERDALRSASELATALNAE